VDHARLTALAAESHAHHHATHVARVLDAACDLAGLPALPPPPLVLLDASLRATTP